MGVAVDGDVFQLECVDVFDVGVQGQGGERVWCAAELLGGLVHVVEVEVDVAEAVHELPHLEVADLGDEVGEQGVRGDVEGHAEEDVGAALVQLAGQRAVRDVELEQGVAWG